MPASVAIESMSHVEEFFAHDDLERSGSQEFNSLQVDQDEVLASTGVKYVCSANRATYAPTDPLVVCLSVRGDPEVVGWQPKPLNVFGDEGRNTCVFRIENHGTQGPRELLRKAELPIRQYSAGQHSNRLALPGDDR